MPKVNDNNIEAFYAAVGRNIRNVRIRHEVSQAQLANLIGFNRSSVANLEAGRQRIALHLFSLSQKRSTHAPKKFYPICNFWKK